MVFSDPKFLFVFLPAALIAGLLFRRTALFSPVILLFSLVFFYWSSGAYTLLLLASIAANWAFGLAVFRWRRRLLLAAAVFVNLAVLGFFKYLGFVLEPLGYLGSDALFDFATGIVLPIGISFYTFQGLSYVIDVWRGTLPKPERNPILFAAYLAFFPQLIAGPIVRFGDVVADFHAPKLSADMFAAGAARFLVGLAKKVLVADLVAPIADAAFDQSGDSLTFAGAWIGSLAYTVQIYFDFSGYSDMAIGLSRLFGVRLPLNFASPYKAANIVEFWRCWHMTLSRFLRDYLYIPLGGNRCGKIRQQANLMLTMLLGGLWHGAGWNFVIWGGLHGLFLVLNHAWRASTSHLPSFLPARVARVLAIALTFLCVVFAWVYFRAPDLPTANRLVIGMLGGFGAALPDSIASLLASTKPLLEHAGIITYLGGGTIFLETWTAVTCSALIAFVAPNTQQIMSRFNPALCEAGRMPERPSTRLLWAPQRLAALAVGLLFAAGVLALSRPTEFLYFQF